MQWLDCRDWGEAALVLEILPDAGDPGRLRLVGELDLATSPALLEAAAEASKKARPGGVTLDLSELTFLDSTGISAIISISGGLESGALVLLAPQAHVARVLRLVRADSFPNVEIRWAG